MEEATRPYLRDRKLDMPLRNKDDSVMRWCAASMTVQKRCPILRPSRNK